ncbi:S1/P1 nuclease [Aestuariibacter salexigens]|uniref:S1/P1 nuclease n=1 Tax=Aestuariibacter salexigens TaxID=226010 RepID=UPI00042459D7|nr:S1/P1 nuclease [Aestuariibacter salexigens]
MKTLYTVFFALACTLSASQALAWGQIGHRVTGAIAEQHLTEQAQAAINEILPNESLAEASTWPDEMRSNPAEFWQKEAGPWHYVTVPHEHTYSDVGAPEQGDAYSALKTFRATLLDKDASMADKQLALRFIVHNIGDLHQPLHVGNGKDRGGNDVRVEFFWESSNLHRVWDSGLIDRRQLSYTEWTAWLSEKITPELKAQWYEADPLAWIAESAEMRDAIYPQGDKISWDYLYQHIPTVKLRLQQSGIRIAAYLNEVFAQDTQP